MSPLLAQIVDWKALGESTLASMVAGILVATSFSLGIVGTTKAAEFRRQDRHTVAAVAGALGALALLIAAGTVVLGVLVMIE